jgi:predicted flavoprotein YhiN
MAQPAVEIDLKPAFTLERLVAKSNAVTATSSLERASTAWRLSRLARALLRLRAPEGNAAELAALAKSFPLALKGPRPIQEAISSAGGIDWDALDDHLMLRRWPGIFCAGEMIDWEAPTGGYLLQGCFSTATRAARGAIAFFRL